MNLDDTIVAIATPAGHGGIGVVRLAGARALEIAAPMLRLKHSLEPGRAVFGELVEPDVAEGAEGVKPPTLTAKNAVRMGRPLQENAGRIDEVVVTYFAKPHSYTTDDIVEISAHGSPVVLRHIVELCVAAGARLAEPGEFTMRAFLNGRTVLEAGIDFAEDDVSIMPDGTILAHIVAVRTPLEQLGATFTYGKIVHEGLTLAIVGRPNVGKSSLFNRLVERERAIVTATPGTTRDLVSETVAIAGIPVKLVDTAGIRTALDEAEAIGIRKSKEALADADLVLVVFDASQAETAEDTELLRLAENRPVIVVENKCDLGSSDQGLVDSDQKVRTSAVTGEGVPELREEILRHIGGEGGVQTESGFLTNVRHQGLIQDSLAALEAAKNAIAGKVPHEMLLLDLYSALRPLDAITGATTTDDILNLIFSTFCIGK